MYLKNASLAEDDKAYVVYYADNVAAFSDRREAEAGEGGFDKAMPLESIFNILNGNHGQSHYAMQVLNPKNGIIIRQKMKYLWMNIFISPSFKILQIIYRVSR